MGSRLLAVIATVGALALSACADGRGLTNRQLGTAAGAVVGGAVGSAVLGGPVGTIGGAAVGGVIGNDLSKERR